MKQRFAAVLILFAFLLLVFSPGTVQAAPVVGVSIQESVPNLEDLAATIKTLAGFALLGAAVLNAGKYLGWIKDGQSKEYTLIYQAVLFTGVLVAQLTGRSDLVPIFDEQAGAFALLINSVLAFALQLYGARLAHEQILAGFPLIGKSFSGRVAGENMIASIELNDKSQ